MGVGTPIDLLEAVHRGVDMFDCILPGALGEQGVAFTYNGKVKLKRATYKFDEAPLDENCTCLTCKRHSRSYLHHLIKGEESVGKSLITHHNIHFYLQLMRDIRESILKDEFLAFYEKYRTRLAADDEKHPIQAPKVSKKRERPTQRGAYSLVQNSQNGKFSIKHNDSGEVMHSSNDPVEESKTLYVNQSRFPESLKARESDSRPLPSDAAPLVIWDVGLGAAFNAMTAIREIENLHSSDPTLRPVKIISFENDLDPLRLSLSHHSKMAHLWHEAPHELLANQKWKSKSGRVEWQLVEGDFKALFEGVSELPDLIYFDPFSTKVNTELWGLDVFQKLVNLSERKGHSLFTYTASTAVRSLLLIAGYNVGAGASTGLKTETTLAWTKNFDLFTNSSLDKKWFERWTRSSSRWPVGFDPMAIPSFEKQIENYFSV